MIISKSRTIAITVVVAVAVVLVVDVVDTLQVGTVESCIREQTSKQQMRVRICNV